MTILSNIWKSIRKAAPLNWVVLVLGAMIYSVFSTGWLVLQGLSLVASLGISVISFAFMTSLLIGIFRALRSRFEREEETSEDLTSEQLRRRNRIKALKREAGKTRQKILRLGALISLGLVGFAALMGNILGISYQQLYIVPTHVLALIWLVQIVFLPRGVTIGSFIIMCLLRVGSLFIGPQILIYLPNFLMLPFFYLAMMFFMFGSIMIPNLQQIKYYKPGEGDWETPAGSTRGQFIARAMIETQIDRFIRHATGKSDRKPTRGMVFTGPPGTGKTLYSKELATELNLPFVMADAAAFNAPFMGFGMLIPLIVKARTESLAQEYGGAIVFIDEGEILFGARSGMQQGQQPQGLGLMDLYDNSGDVIIERDHEPIFMMPGAGAAGAGAAIFPFLTWMSGTPSPPFMTKFIRGRLNTLLDALFFVPVTFRRRLLRFGPGKPRESNVMFITATNRFFMFDPAMIRPGRFGIVAEFVIPDEEERKDIAQHYLKIWYDKGYYQDEILDRIEELARATINTSPAEIEQMIEEAVDIRVQHVAELRRVKRYVDEGREEELSSSDKKFWLRFKNMVYDSDGQVIEGWDDERVDWQALMETRSSIRFGRANPEASNEVTKKKVAFHELGHFIALNSFNRDRMRPTILSVIPRRGTLGRIAHVPHDTREQHPQEFYEGLVRTSIAAWVTERFFFGQNLPGVSGDLQNATSVSVMMVGKFGMKNFKCNKSDREYYAGIGSTLISEPETNVLNPQATALVESVLRNPDRRKDVAVIIGMAAVDAYRVIRRNQEFFLDVIPRFLELDEISGGRLERLWDRMVDEIVPLSEMSKEDQVARPKNGFAVPNSFYKLPDPEGKDIAAKIEALLMDEER